MVGWSLAIGLLKGVTGDDGVSLSELYQRVPWQFWLAGILLIAWFICALMLTNHAKVQKERRRTESEEGSPAFSQLHTVLDTIYAELGVPSDAQAVDILSFKYKMKNGAPKAYEETYGVTPYENFEFRMFTDSENLYLAEAQGKYGFPLSSLRAIRTVEKRIAVPSWNKEIGPNEGD